MPEHKATLSIDPESLGLDAGETVTVTLSRETEAAPVDPGDDNGDPGQDPPDDGEPQLPSSEDLSGVWGETILSLPEYPAHAEVDLRDVSVVVNNGKAYSTRLRRFSPGLSPIEPGTPDQPGTGPVVTKTLGTRGTVNIFDEGGRGESRAVDSKAMTDALSKVKDGGKLFVPYGKWQVSDVKVPGFKDIIIEGETELGAELVGKAGSDVLAWEDDATQRRLQNRPIIRNLRFYMPGNGSMGGFNRKTAKGWRVGAACLAWIQKSPTADGNRKDAWGNSYVTVQNCTARGDKNAVGASFLYSDRALYGCRVQNLFVGDHGSTVSGLPGGIIMGQPPFPTSEYAPDEFGVDHFVHWGGQVSIAVSNVANGHIRDHKAYTCRYPLHLTGQDNNGPRDRGREFELSALYYDNDVVVSSTADDEMIHLDLDNCRFDTIHVKGSRGSNIGPVLAFRGTNIRDGVVAMYSSAGHAAPRLEIAGSGHRFDVDPRGFSAGDLSVLFNGKPSYPGITVL
jgi:hypothetical protein